MLIGIGRVAVLIGGTVFCELRLLACDWAIRSVEKAVSARIGGDVLALHSRYLARINDWGNLPTALTFRGTHLLTWITITGGHFGILYYLAFHSALDFWYFHVLSLVLAMIPVMGYVSLLVGGRRLTNEFDVLATERTESVARLPEATQDGD